MLSVFANQVHRRGFDWQYLGLAVSNVRQVGYYAAVGGSAALACAVQSRGWRSAGFGAAAALVLAMLLWVWFKRRIDRGCGRRRWNGHANASISNCALFLILRAWVGEAFPYREFSSLRFLSTV